MSDYADSLIENEARDEYRPNCRRCGHPYEFHFDLVENCCSECICVDYAPEERPDECS
jgi:hypothetical protein